MDLWGDDMLTLDEFAPGARRVEVRDLWRWRVLRRGRSPQVAAGPRGHLAFLEGGQSDVLVARWLGCRLVVAALLRGEPADGLRPPVVLVASEPPEAGP